MAKYSSVSLGKARGSIGNVRFQVWKGVAVAAQKPESVANPRTPRQLSARSRIALLVSIYKKIPVFTNIVWGFQAIRKSAYNAWLGAQNKKEYLVFDFSAIATGIALGAFQIANKSSFLAPSTVADTGTNINIGFTGLAPSTAYTINCIGIQAETLFSENPQSLPFTTDSTGLGGLSVPISSFGFKPDAVAYALQNSVTGEIFAYYEVL